jgi:hypothetical protein
LCQAPVDLAGLTLAPAPSSAVRARRVLRKELEFAADFLNAVANVVEPAFDLFGTFIDRVASFSGQLSGEHGGSA